MDNTVKVANANQLELTDEQQELINSFAQNGNDEIDNENYEHAIGWFTKALDIVPEPKKNWLATGWLCASIGDVYFSLKEYAKALSNLHSAYEIYGPDDRNPFVVLKIGQCYFHLENFELADTYLYQAYLLEGEDLFKEEPLYFDFLKSKYAI